MEWSVNGIGITSENVCKVGVGFEIEDEVPGDVMELVAMMFLTIYNLSFSTGNFKSLFIFVL